uniref:MHC class I-like antigen recognition-like domain-containing protein n=1 Tax=Anabas testudineus TaxID=64144 RepID=A0A7N6FAB6_ANATE
MFRSTEPTQIKMKTIYLLFLFCHVSSSVKHSLKLFLATTTGVSNIPEFIMTGFIDDVQVIYCDNNRKMEPKRDAMKNILEDEPQFLIESMHECFERQPNFYKNILNIIMKHLNQCGGVHVLQTQSGCEWDKNTGEVVFDQYGYDGEHVVSLDLKKLTWITLKPEDVPMKQFLDADKVGIIEAVISITQIHPESLKKYLKYEDSFSLRPGSPAAVIGVVVGLLLLIVCITEVFIWWKKNNGFRAANTSSSNR